MAIIQSFSNALTISSLACLLILFLGWGQPSNAAVPDDAMLIKLKRDLDTGLQLGSTAIRELRPTQNYFRNLNLPGREVLQALLNLFQYQKEVNHSLANSQVDAVADTVLQAVLDDACSWLESVLGNDSFNCTKDGVEELKAWVEMYHTMQQTAIKYRRLCGRQCPAAHCFSTWVTENIPCEGNGRKARDYLASGNIKIVNSPLIGCPSISSITCSN